MRIEFQCQHCETNEEEEISKEEAKLVEQKEMIPYCKWCYSEITQYEIY